jgi:hypothetical protein
MALIEAARATIRRIHLSPRTEEAYLHWIRAFITFHRGRHPRDLAPDDLVAFLNHLAVERRVSASTQNQALCARDAPARGGHLSRSAHRASRPTPALHPRADSCPPRSLTPHRR